MSKHIPKSVELISAGYEWHCPKCDEYNKEIEVKETVQCPTCKTTFEVSEYHHAMA
jgi:rubrerythrin